MSPHAPPLRGSQPQDWGGTRSLPGPGADPAWGGPAPDRLSPYAPRPVPAAPCPCGRAGARGRPLAVAVCCGRYIGSETPAPDAESLMRSRYSAFVLGRADHLLATWHLSTRPAQLALEPGQTWLGLAVKAHRPLDADHTEVEFVARSRIGGRGQRLHETSRFVREGGRWIYLDGDLH